MNRSTKRAVTLLFVQALLLTSVCFGGLSEAVESIDKKAHEHTSDAMIIKKDGKILYQMSSKNEFEVIAAWSVTKSFISLGIGILYDEGKVHPNQPLSDFFPGWDSGEKSQVTIRHLLTHTSGIDHKMNLATALQGDSVQIACEKDIINEPGTVFHYNNYAVNILSGIIQKTTGERADLFIKRSLLDYLDITNYSWDVDEAGHAFGMCGLHIRADELIKLGELMLNKGVWNGQRLISEEWLEMSLDVSVQVMDPHFAGLFDGCGFLWWMGQDTPGFYSAAGMFGQYCVVFPEKGIVAVRQHDYRRHSSWDNIDEAIKYRSFFNDLREFIKEAEKTH